MSARARATRLPSPCITRYTHFKSQACVQSSNAVRLAYVMLGFCLLKVAEICRLLVIVRIAEIIVRLQFRTTAVCRNRSCRKYVADIYAITR